MWNCFNNGGNEDGELLQKQKKDGWDTLCSIFMNKCAKSVILCFLNALVVTLNTLRRHNLAEVMDRFVAERQNIEFSL